MVNVLELIGVRGESANMDPAVTAVRAAIGLFPFLVKRFRDWRGGDVVAVDDPRIPLISLRPEYRPIELARAPRALPENKLKWLPVHLNAAALLEDFIRNRAAFVVKVGRGRPLVVPPSKRLGVLWRACGPHRKPIRPIPDVIHALHRGMPPLSGELQEPPLSHLSPCRRIQLRDRIRRDATLAIRARIFQEVQKPREQGGFPWSDPRRHRHLDRRHGIAPVELTLADVHAEIKKELPLPRLRSTLAGQLAMAPIPRTEDIPQRVGVAAHEPRIDLGLNGRRSG